MSNFSFLPRFLVAAIMIALVLFAIGRWEYVTGAMQFAWISYAVFFALTLITFIIISRSLNSRFQQFMNIFFTGMIIKFFVAGTMVLIYKSITGVAANSIAFAIPFAWVYFSFLIWETVWLLRMNKKTVSK
jgi:O-antigen/teichoic acid export membrane protein